MGSDSGLVLIGKSKHSDRAIIGENAGPQDVSPNRFPACSRHPEDHAPKRCCSARTRPASCALENFIRIPNTLIDFSDLVLPLRDLGSCLAGCITDAPELQEEVALLLEERNRQIQWERETDLYAVVVEAMFSLCHEENKDSLHVGEITVVANEILKRLGEALEMDPRSVGDKLRLLCLATRRLDAAGRGMLLAWDYKVPGVDGNVWQCQYCQEAGRVQPMMPAAYPS